MRTINQARLLGVGALTALLLSGCGSGSGGNSSPKPTDPTNPEPPVEIGKDVTGAAVKGPLANALVEAYRLDYQAADLRGALVGSGETDGTAKFSNLNLDPDQGPFLLVITADSDTVDLTTGTAPVITSIKTILTSAQLDGETPVYATPLTSLAVTLAAKQGTTAETLQKSLETAQNQVKSTLGFGMNSEIDLFTAPPLLTDSTKDVASQQAVAEYRLAVEAVSAILNDIAAKTTSEDDNADDMLAAIADDLSDGTIDGMVDGEALTAFNGTIVANEIRQDLANLTIPGTNISVTAIETVLAEETATTGTETQLNEEVSAEGKPAKTSIDSDLDGVIDSEDAFPFDPMEWADTDQDGIGNDSDAFPTDPSEWLDSDGDGTGNNRDAFPNDPEEDTDSDSDGVGDNRDVFPNNPAESSDSDNDGVGDNTDPFPNNPNETVDADKDGTGDNSDNCPQIANSDQADSDNDGIGNACDAVDGPNQTTWDQSRWDDGSTWQ